MKITPKTLVRSSRIFLGSVLLLAPFFLSCIKEKEEDRPNIIYIMVDDMGYSDLGCYGGEIETPNLDEIAAGGIKMRSFYNNARCCPTRASLLTGRYPHEVGMGHMVSTVGKKYEEGSYQGFLHQNIPTIAELLREAGYRTYMSGKWHVGERPEHWPRKRGFDRYFGLINGASSFYEVIPQEKGKRQFVLDDEEYQTPPDFYATDAFTDFALQYLDDHRTHQQGAPFFLYLAYTAPHFPLHAPESDVEKYLDLYKEGWDVIRERRFQRMKRLGVIDERFTYFPRPEDIPAWEEVDNKEEWVRKMAVYAAMIDRMDQNIGRLVEKLKANGQWDNTLIVFISDNGACAENVAKRNFHDPQAKIGARGSYVTYDTPWANVSNTPFKKYKRYLHEGGVISPCIISWPEKIKPQSNYHSVPGYIVDLVPTALELAGRNADIPLAGKSLSPLWTGEPIEERIYCWEHEGNQAIRVGDWKLVKDKQDPTWALYNIDKDPSEAVDLSSSESDRTATMQKMYEEWVAKVGAKPYR